MWSVNQSHFHSYIFHPTFATVIVLVYRGESNKWWRAAVQQGGRAEQEREREEEEREGEPLKPVTKE